MAVVALHLRGPVSALPSPIWIKPSRTRTSYICSGREKATSAGYDGKDGLGVLIEDSESMSSIEKEIAAERVQNFRTVELNKYE